MLKYEFSIKRDQWFKKTVTCIPVFQNFTGICWQYLNNLLWWSSSQYRCMRESQFMDFSFKTPILNNDKLKWFSYSKTALTFVSIFFLKTNLNYNKSTHNRFVLKRNSIESQRKRKPIFLELEHIYIFHNILPSRSVVC